MFLISSRHWANLLENLGLTSSKSASLKPADLKEAREYIDAYWQKLERNRPQDEDTLIGLPHPYIVPATETSNDFGFDEMYYWDTYFIVQGMLDDRHQGLVEGILENLLYLCGRYGMIPNGSRTYLTGRSQPPLLTSMIFDVYEAYGKDVAWLQPRIALAKLEYHAVWMGERKPHARQVYQGLSRYYEINMTHDMAEAESGWDYTPRFERRALNFLPVDLNALLYKYEKDFARAARLAGNVSEAKEWEQAARQRKRTMNRLMWDGRRGLFYDYDYVNRERGNVSSLASYYCLWAGLATREQARAMVRALRRFEYEGGLTATDDIPLKQRLHGRLPTQWAYPNGWAPLHLMTVQGLERYGQRRPARRIAMAWLGCNLQWFKDHGVFQEKYNVVEPGQPANNGVYPAPNGFGWTNGVFERLCRDYVDRS